MAKGNNKWVKQNASHHIIRSPRTPVEDPHDDVMLDDDGKGYRYWDRADSCHAAAYEARQQADALDRAGNRAAAQEAREYADSCDERARVVEATMDRFHRTGH